jgi:hypothetical protein
MKKLILITLLLSFFSLPAQADRIRKYGFFCPTEDLLDEMLRAAGKKDKEEGLFIIRNLILNERCLITDEMRVSTIKVGWTKIKVRLYYKGYSFVGYIPMEDLIRD